MQQNQNMEVEPTSTPSSSTTITSSLSSLPFKRVVIYKNGVAYFEREGKVTGNCSIDLRFKPSEMNDIIRSLRVVDLGGGKIANISYEAPPASELASSPSPQPNIRNMMPHADNIGTIFGFVAGSNVRVSQINSDKVVEGRVIGTSNRIDGGITSQIIQLLVDNTRVHFLDVGKISSLEIVDAHVQGNVKEHLDSVLNSTKKDTRQVNIICKGEGVRSLRVSYILENPIWKSNYRIYMKKGPEGGKEQFFLEGWACVDNISEDDWNEVSLALVSGSPISFQHEVYNPVIGVRPESFSDEGKTAQNITLLNKNISPAIPSHFQRQQQQQQQLQQIQQQQLRNQVQHQQQLAQMQMGQLQLAQAPYSSSPQMPGIYPVQPAPLADIDSQTVEIGNLFHYEINTPITVKKDHSSLVPTVSGPLKGRKVCWFDPKRHAVNPMESIMLQNTLGTILDKGPVIVTEAENYLGESLFENTMMQEEHKLLPYSVNLECKISKTSSSSLRPKSTIIRSGMAFVSNTQHHNTAYALANNSEHEIELVLDHEEFIENKIEGAKNQAKFKNGTRFYVMLPPLKKSVFNIPVISTAPVMEKRLGDFTNYEIARLYSTHFLTKQAYDELSAIYIDAGKVSKLGSGLVQEKAAEEQIIADQRRIQSLINPRSGSGQVNTFEKQIADLETQLTKSRHTYEEKYQIWKGERKAVIKRMNDLRIDINLETAEISREHCAEVGAQLATFSQTTLDELLSNKYAGKPSKRQRH